MKGQTESYSFLIGIIITLLILLPLGIFVYNYIESKTLTEKCLAKLESEVTNLQDGESKSITCNIGGGKVLVSFNSGKDSKSSFFTSQFVTYNWRYPEKCDGACICACKKESAIGGMMPFAGGEDCGEKGETCFSVEWAREVQGQVLQKPIFAGGQPKPIFDDFFTYDDGIYNLILERKGFVLGICAKQPCIKEKTPKIEAVKLFNYFVAAYNKTKNYDGENCIGQSFDFSLLPEGYAVEVTGSYGKPVELKLIDEEGSVIDESVVENNQICTFEFNEAADDFEKDDIYIFRIGDKDESGFIYKSETDFSYKSKYQLFKYDDTFTCFVQDVGHDGFNKIHSVKKPCESQKPEKKGELF